MKIKGFKDEHILHDSGRSIVYRIFNEETGKPFILKIPGFQLPIEKAKLLYQSEYEIGQKLHSKLHPKYFRFDFVNGKPYLLVEDFGGVSLDQLIPEKGFEIVSFFTYAIQIVQSIAQLHQQKIIHKDICPSNIATNQNTGELKLIDFGSASPFFREIGDNRTDLTQATLAYISPEQTGRMNRLVTYKTDFYSLGITFFHMLTGRLPFPSKDSSDLIYHHIASEPPGVKEVNPSIPTQLAHIVERLLRKNPEERYSSALGILSDLEKCKDHWSESNTIPIFPLGANDVSEVFSIPEKLYGRTNELDIVGEYFHRALSGQITVTYIKGSSGIGKSAFVSELYKDFVKEKGNFGTGKFDQFQRNVPYSALINALNQIIQQILTKDDKQKAKWKNILIDNLGSNAGILISVLPDLELIMGTLELVETTSPELLKNRFIIAFKNLIKSFSQPDAPLILFLDDLQWIDPATLQLFTDFFNSIDTDEKNYTLIIGAYRDNEVGPDHPLSMVLRGFYQKGFPDRSITLMPLDVEAINELCADSLEREPAETMELAQLLFSKTGGSPFFIKQFLETLYERDFIYLNRKSRKWTWNMDQVKSAGFTDNVVDLIKQKLYKLENEVQLVLKTASCLGETFEANDIVQILHFEPDLVNELLIGAMNEDIIYKMYSDANLRYKFQHDRIQNTAYSLNSADELNQLHFRIGMYIIGKPDLMEGNAAQTFDILQHLNRSTDLITDSNTRLKLANLNFKAGEIGRRSNAYEAALEYAEKGIAFLPSDPWASNYDLARDLYQIGVETAYLTGEYSKMHSLAEQSLASLTDPVEKARIHEIVTYAYASKTDWVNAVNETLNGLKVLGIRLPKQPGTMQVLRYLGRFFWVLGRRKPEDLVNLPTLDNDRVEAAIKLFISAASASYLTNQNLFAIFFIEMCRLNAIHGNSKYSAFAYAGFGVFYGGALGRIDYAYRFGDLAKSVFDKYRSEDLQAKIYFSLYAFIKNWKVDVKKIYPLLTEGFHAGAQAGETEYAAWCLGMRSGMSTLTGEPLDQVEKDLIATIKYSRNLSHIRVIAEGFLHYANWWTNKLEEEDDPLSKKYVDRRAPQFLEAKFYTALAEHGMMHGSIYLASGDYDRAWKYLQSGWEHHKSLVGLFYYAQLAYYRAWCAIKVKQHNTTIFSDKELREIIKDFSKWGVHNEITHGHKLIMLDAEMAILKGDRSAAMDLFDQAINRAEETNHPNDHGLFCEVLANHYLSWDKREFAMIYLHKAHKSFSKWGAVRKCLMLEEKFPRLTQHQGSYVDISDVSNSVDTREMVKVLDVNSIIKASQAISSELQLDSMLNRLLTILSENAGAQRVIILLKDKEGMFVEALKEIDQEAIRLNVAISEFGDIPKSVVTYIENTKNAIVLEKAYRDGAFTRDEYIVREQMNSILGIPIVRQGKLEGIIYMDNQLTEGVFTPERVDILKTLSSQVAISIENAKYIKQMQLLNTSYNRFVPNEFLRLLGRESILEVNTGDQEIKEMVILFADIRNFTSICETIPANETFSMLNNYLSKVTPAIHDNGGTIDKFMGDGIMALFPNDVDRALLAAVEIQRNLVEYNRERELNNELAIQIGVGLHVGNVILGTVGTENRMSTTVIGDPVNLSARLEAYTKTNKATILLTGEMVSRLDKSHSFHLRSVGSISAKGKKNKVNIFEEYSCVSSEAFESIDSNKDAFEYAVVQFDKELYTDANTSFENYLSIVPTDKVAQYFHSECLSVLNLESTQTENKNE